MSAVGIACANTIRPRHRDSRSCDPSGTGFTYCAGIKPISCPRGTLEPRRPKTSARRESLRYPCSPLLRFQNGVPAELLSPSSRATPSPSEVRQRFLQTQQCPGLPRLASYLATHQELCGAQQCFWAISHKVLHHCAEPTAAAGKPATSLRFRRQSKTYSVRPVFFL
jgi:hypothetical protein